MTRIDRSTSSRLWIVDVTVTIIVNDNDNGFNLSCNNKTIDRQGDEVPVVDGEETIGKCYLKALAIDQHTLSCGRSISY